MAAPIKAQPIVAGAKYVDPSAPTGLTQAGIRHFNQWQLAINSVPLSVSGEQVAGAGMKWTLANAPSGNVLLFGVTDDGLLPLAAGAGKPWNYAIDGMEITTAQTFQGLIASYEF